MSRSSALAFVDSDQYQAAIRAGRAQLFVTTAGTFQAELTRIDLNRLWLQCGRENLARLVRVAIDMGRAPIFFLSDADQAPVQNSGIEVAPGDLAVYGAGALDVQRTSGPHRWSAMSVATDHLAEIGEAIAGRPLTAPPDTYVFRPAAAPMARLMTLHSEAARLAKHDPAALAEPAISKALEQDLLREMVACLTSADPAETRRSWHHAKVMLRFEEFLASKRYEPVYVAEICAAIRVSERTLRTCCQEHLGMGPVRYLWLRRMHLAHRALLRADAMQTTVTEIATAHGFWELGRFSVEYRSLFGEPPSLSLKHPPELSTTQRLH